jgi:hypothetical protein
MSLITYPVACQLLDGDETQDFAFGDASLHAFSFIYTRR